MELNGVITLELENISLFRKAYQGLKDTLEQNTIRLYISQGDQTGSAIMTTGTTRSKLFYNYKEVGDSALIIIKADQLKLSKSANDSSALKLLFDSLSKKTPLTTFALAIEYAHGKTLKVKDPQLTISPQS